MNTETKLSELERRIAGLEADNKLLRELLDLRVRPVEDDLTLIQRRLMATSKR